MKKLSDFKFPTAYHHYLKNRREMATHILSGIAAGPVSQDNTNQEAVKLAVFLTDLLLEELEKK